MLAFFQRACRATRAERASCLSNFDEGGSERDVGVEAEAEAEVEVVLGWNGYGSADEKVDHHPDRGAGPGAGPGWDVTVGGVDWAVVVAALLDVK
jgi:hypothetical protein